MEIGLGVLGRPADDFWAMTMPEFAAALDGYLEARGERRAARPPTRAELEDLMARFPD